MFSQSEPYLLRNVAQYLTVSQTLNLYQSSKYHALLFNYLIDRWDNFVDKCRKNETFSSVAIRNINRPRLCKLVYSFKYNWVHCVREVWKDITPIINSYPDNHFVHKIYYLCSKTCIEMDNPDAFSYLRNWIHPQIIFNKRNYAHVADHNSSTYSMLAFFNTSERIFQQMNYKYNRITCSIFDLFTIVRLHYFRLTEVELIEALITIQKSCSTEYPRKVMKLNKFFRYHAPKHYRNMAKFLEI